MKYRTVGDFQRALEESFQKIAALDRVGGLPPCLEALAGLVPPEGSRVSVSLCYADTERRIRSDAGAHKWRPEECLVEIAYEPAEEGEEEGEFEEVGETEEDPMVTMVQVVHEAEQDPSLHFIAFKFLRDRLLPQTGCPWTRSFDYCQNLISEAIEQEILSTEKIANPRHPEFPVTGVRLNREHTFVRENVQSETGSPGGAPVEVGEDLAADKMEEEAGSYEESAMPAPLSSAVEILGVRTEEEEG